jgi:hypothetical protein
MSAVPNKAELSVNRSLLGSKDFDPGASIWRLRPTFEFVVREARESIMEKFDREYERIADKDRFFMHGEYGELHLPREEHRLWSPHLSFYVAERDGHSLIHGRFAPRIEIWTFVWFVYLAMACSAFFGLMLAYSQFMLGETPWGIAVTAAGIATIVLLYGIAHVGQHWSSDQMYALRVRLDELLESAGVER